MVHQNGMSLPKNGDFVPELCVSKVVTLNRKMVILPKIFNLFVEKKGGNFLDGPITILVLVIWR